MNATKTTDLISRAADLRDAYAIHPSPFLVQEFDEIVEEMRDRKLLACLPGYPAPRIESPIITTLAAWESR